MIQQTYSLHEVRQTILCASFMGTILGWCLHDLWRLRHVWRKPKGRKETP
jgi:hypothetical protein